MFVKKNNFKKVINDTIDQYSKIIENKTLPVFGVLNSEDKILYFKDDVKANFVDLNEVRNNFKCLNIDKYESYKLADSSVGLYKPVPPILNRKKDNFVVLDNFDKIIKEYNINTGKLKRKIEVDSALEYYFVKDSINFYKNELFEEQMKTKFLYANYDQNDNIIVTANAFKGFSNNIPPKKRLSEIMTLQYNNQNDYIFIDLNDSIYITDILNTENGLLSLVSYRHSRFDDLNYGNYYMAVILDSLNYKIINHYLKYSEIFKFYKLDNFINSVGLICELGKNKYAYLNPWNGIFCKFGDVVQDSLHIQGYLEMIKSTNASKVKKELSKYGYDYKIMSLNSYNNKAVIFMHSFDKSNQITFSIIQVYDEKSGLEKEIILNSTVNKYFRSYFLKIENDLIYLLDQDESEEWKIIKIPVFDVF